jgi:hypothetical protein
VRSLKKGRGQRSKSGRSNIEYVPVKQRASKATHMEHINPKKSNRKRQARTHAHRDPNEQSDDMNPKKNRKRGTGIIPAQSHGYQSNNKAVKAQPGRDETRPKRKKAQRVRYKPRTLFLNPHSKGRGGVGRSDRMSNLLCTFPARFGRAVTAWSACT